MMVLSQRIAQRQEQQPQLIHQVETLDPQITATSLQQLQQLQLLQTQLQHQLQTIQPLATAASAHVPHAQDLITNASIENALHDAKQQNVQLKHQLLSVTVELDRLEKELDTKTHHREAQHELYRQERKASEENQRLYMTNVVNDLKQHEQLVALEEEGREEAVAQTVVVQEQLLSQHQQYAQEEVLVLSEHQDLLRAWSVQESALVDSLDDIEQEATLLREQSTALRRRRTDEESQDGDQQEHVSKDITNAEIEAELFHCLALMKTKHAQLGVLKRKLAILYEERSALNVVVSTWREENHARRACLLQEEAAIGQGMAGEGTARGDPESAEAQLLHHLHRMTEPTAWGTIEEERTTCLYDIANATDLPRTGDHSAPGATTAARTMWLGKHWALKDDTEQHAELEYRHYVSRVKHDVEDLLVVQRNVSAKMNSSNKKWKALKEQHQRERMQQEIRVLKRKNGIGGGGGGGENAGAETGEGVNDEQLDKAKALHVQLDRLKRELSKTNVRLKEEIVLLERHQLEHDARVQLVQEYDTDMLQWNKELQAMQLEENLEEGLEEDVEEEDLEEGLEEHLEKGVEEYLEEHVEEHLASWVVPASQVVPTEEEAGRMVWVEDDNGGHMYNNRGVPGTGGVGLMTPSAPAGGRKHNTRQQRKRKKKKKGYSSSSANSAGGGKNSPTRSSTAAVVAEVADKLYFLAQGGTVVEQPSGEPRMLRVSKDFERLEVRLVSSSYNTTTFYRTTLATSIHQNRKQKMFSVLFEASDRVTFGCASLKELDQWVDALQLLLYHSRDGRGGLAKLRYQLKKYGVV